MASNCNRDYLMLQFQRQWPTYNFDQEYDKLIGEGKSVGETEEALRKIIGDEIKKRMNILNFLEASRGTSSSVDTRPTSADGLFSNSPEAERRRVRTLLELLTAEFESDRKMDMYMILLRMIREENRKAQSASPTGGTIEEPDEVNEEDEEYEEMYEEDDMNEEDEEMTEVDPCHTPTSLPSSDPAEPELPTTERAFNPVRTYSQKKWDDEKSGKLLCNTDERNIIHGQKRRGPSSM